MSDKRKTHPKSQNVDSGGNILDFHISDSELVAINISNGYIAKGIAINNGFFICPLTTGIIKLKLLGQKGTTRTLTIPAARIDVMIGQWMEEKCVEIIKDGTTVTSALIGWSN